MNPLDRISTFRSFHRSLPWKNRMGGTDWVTSGGPFNPAMSIKLLPLKDMSKPEKKVYNEFDKLVFNMRENLKKGDAVKAVPVNTDGSEFVEGRVSDIKIDYHEQSVRVFVRDRDSNKVVEVYPHSIFREAIKMAESKIPTFEEYSESV